MRLRKKVYIVLVILAILALIFASLPVFAIDITSSADEKVQLEQQLQEIQNEIAQYQQQLTTVQSQKNTLNNKIQQLKIQQNKIALQIKATTIDLQNTSDELTQTESNINQNTTKISDLKNQMAQLIQSIYESGESSSLEILLAQGGFSGFYDQLNNYQQLNSNLSDILNQVRDQTAQLQDQQTKLASERDQQQSLIQISNLQNQQLASTIGDQNQLLAATKGQEANYQTILNNKKQAAADIQNRLYSLLGISTQITFGQAYDIAQYASSQTGVRPAFLLAILTQESNLGRNVGTCNRPGDPPSKSWKVVMKPDRDQTPFLQITSELGLDPNTTPVSCPLHDSRGNQVGWGGAMGPAQFIPSTWMGYKDKVSAITGKTANPWDIRDAFLASAIKLAASGAKSQSGEWSAAMIYFSGSTNVRYRFYGDNVVATAAKYQNDISALVN